MSELFFFGKGVKKTGAINPVLLGNKGAQLANLTKIGLPVPPGFTITTKTCNEYLKKKGRLGKAFESQFQTALTKLETLSGKWFGDPSNPLLVSCRSGASVSMPGMMDTILNIGLNDDTTKGMGKLYNNMRFALDCYRRLITMFADTVYNAGKDEFEHALDAAKKKSRAHYDYELSVEDLEKVISDFKRIYKKLVGNPFPQDIKEQIKLARNAVFDSWNNKRAVQYRKIYGIPSHYGTACNIQTMVFGNLDDNSGTGVGFTRNVATGRKTLYGEFLSCAQGEDVVAGIRTPLPLSDLQKRTPRIFAELRKIVTRLEKYFKDVQDFEFTIEKGTLYFLQARNAKRSGIAAIKIAVDMVKEGLISKKEAVNKVNNEHLESILHPIFDENIKKKHKVICKGLNASPGAASGIISLTPETAVKAAQKVNTILVRPETSPDDIMGMKVSDGILTARGGYTSHAAVVARGMGKPAVVGCNEISFSGKNVLIRSMNGTLKLKEGDEISIDGATGNVYKGRIPTTDILRSRKKSNKAKKYFDTFMKYVDDMRKIEVKANADTPEDLKLAVQLGAEGVGLCRTEHMFFQQERLRYIRRALFSSDQKARKDALRKIFKYQLQDFKELFRVIRDKPITIRTIDPPLHEFLPNNEEIKGIKNKSEKKKWERLREELSEINPMMGLRGCRVTLKHKDLLDVQIRAIFTAACEIKKKFKIDVKPRVMIPLISTTEEMKIHREITIGIAKEVEKKFNTKIKYMVGTMIEVPRAALAIKQLSKYLDFFSFGTNDLTQMTFAFSRDDINKFLPDYLEDNILEFDPFVRLDQEGVGELMKFAIKNGGKLTKGICGEHGGDYHSVLFCNSLNLDYVSASPYRIPIAKLASAHYVTNSKGRN